MYKIKYKNLNHHETYFSNIRPTFLGISTSSNTTTSGSCEFQEVLSESYSGFWKLYGIADAYPYPGTRFFGNNSYNSYAGVYIGGLCFGCAVDDSDSYAMVYCDRGMMHVQWKFSIHGRVSFWEDFGVLLGSGRFKRFFRIS